MFANRRRKTTLTMVVLLCHSTFVALAGPAGSGGATAEASPTPGPSNPGKGPSSQGQQQNPAGQGGASQASIESVMLAYGTLYTEAHKVADHVAANIKGQYPQFQLSDLLNTNDIVTDFTSRSPVDLSASYTKTYSDDFRGYTTGPLSLKQKEDLRDTLNNVITGGITFYKSDFGTLVFRSQTQALLSIISDDDNAHLKGDKDHELGDMTRMNDIQLLNRLLLEDIYSDDLGRAGVVLVTDTDLPILYAYVESASQLKQLDKAYQGEIGVGETTTSLADITPYISLLSSIGPLYSTNSSIQSSSITPDHTALVNAFDIAFLDHDITMYSIPGNPVGFADDASRPQIVSSVDKVLSDEQKANQILLTKPDDPKAPVLTSLNNSAQTLITSLAAADTSGNSLYADLVGADAAAQALAHGATVLRINVVSMGGDTMSITTGVTSLFSHQKMKVNGGFLADYKIIKGDGSILKVGSLRGYQDYVKPSEVASMVGAVSLPAPLFGPDWPE